MLFTMQELQAMAGLLNKTPMSPAEMLWANGFLQRLVAFCQPPKPEPEEPVATGATPPPPDGDALRDTVTVPSDAQAMADALAIAEALDEADKETE